MIMVFIKFSQMAGTLETFCPRKFRKVLGLKIRHRTLYGKLQIMSDPYNVRDFLQAQHISDIIRGRNMCEILSRIVLKKKLNEKK